MIGLSVATLIEQREAGPTREQRSAVKTTRTQRGVTMRERDLSVVSLSVERCGGRVYVSVCVLQKRKVSRAKRDFSRDSRTCRVSQGSQQGSLRFPL